MVDRARQPKLAVWKFSSCDGCQLSLLDLEDELLQIANLLTIAYFPEATRGKIRGPYDLSLVEGSISTPGEAERIHRIRRSSHRLVAIGACATTGGIQALRNFAVVDRWKRDVYEHGDSIRALARSTPIADHVEVDLELPGCPVNKHQLAEVIAAVVQRRETVLTTASVCVECKRAGHVCVLVAHDRPCLGPVTRGGCGALCPAYSRGCYGCFGPVECANPSALADRLLDRPNTTAADVVRLFRGIQSGATPFLEEARRHDHEDA